MDDANLALSADLIAVAVVASARLYGDDPLRAFAGKSGHVRRCLLPAVEAIVLATGLTKLKVCRVLGVNNTSLPPALRMGGQAYCARIGKIWRAIEDWADAQDLAALEGSTDEAGEGRPDQDEEGGALLEAPLDAPAAAPAPWKPPVRFVGAAQTPAADRPLSDLILEALADGAHSPSGLASRLGAKELTVGQALSMLRHEGRVTADPLTEKGLRAQLWRLA